MLVTLSGIVTEVKFSHKLNAKSIFITPSGITYVLPTFADGY